ncbi:MAG: hypothetical protein ACE5GC_01865 [Acidimicrobiia bacterium]
MIGLVLLVGACGGGSETEAQSSDQASGTTEASTQGTDAPLAVPPTALPNVPGLSDECEGLANLMLGMSQVFTGDTSAAGQLFAAASQNLPGALTSEIDLIEDAVLQYQAALEEIGVDLSDPTSFATLTPEQAEQMNAAFGPLQSSSVSDAFDAVSAYVAVECAEFVPGG